ncbi:syn-copalyl diphosphate synthase-like, partial [Oryza brachyantha]
GGIGAIRAALRSMTGGEVSISAYDTAWVAMVGRVDGGGDGPQFPSCLEWILENQLGDGSWGEPGFFMACDRVICTLACVVALRTWRVRPDLCAKGVSFIRDNIWKLDEDEPDWMIVGFEITLPTLLQMAKDLGLDLPYDHPVLEPIYAKRDLKLAKIPLDVLHTKPTSLLQSIEGMQGLDWTKLLKFQSTDGSFASCPATTADALIQTGDKRFLDYLDSIVKKFNGGVPMTYPMDIFEHLWAVDRLERLGISRYFASEIKECLDHVYSLWSHDQGLAFTEVFPVSDLDDTSMGFRLLRLHGYDVSSRAFKYFETDGKFSCYPLQLNCSITATYNLYRAAQVAFPGEDVLQQANSYSRAFLSDRLSSNNLVDKWVIPKDLPGEVEYALSFPWKVSLPRVETRMYLEQYGGSGDVWIAKVLYRMPLFCNELYLDVAKSDFRNFQSLCRLELDGLERWRTKNNLEAYGVTRENALRAYFLAAATIFEPDRQEERLAWARTAIVAEAMASHLQHSDNPDSERNELIAKLTTKNHDNQSRCQLTSVLRELIDFHASGVTVAENIQEAWTQWLMAWAPTQSCGRQQQHGGDTALLLARVVAICSGRHGGVNPGERTQSTPAAAYSRVESLARSICNQLAALSHARLQDGKNMETVGHSDSQVDRDMQELTRLVLEGDNGINRVTGQAYLNVVKSAFYMTYSSPATVEEHISKVLFEDVL